MTTTTTTSSITSSTTNKRLPDAIQQAQKAKASHRMKKQRQYFDSADWMLHGQTYQAYPAALERAKENIKVQQPSTTSTSIVQSKDTLFIEELHSEEKTEKGSIVAQQKISTPPERRYFDSADWVLAGKEYNPSVQTYRSFPQQSPAAITAQKKITHKNRKFFDSADWALSGCQPQLLPKLAVLRS